MKTIYIRKMRYAEAELKLEQELNSAFMEGIKEVQIVHGVGEGVLRKMVRKKVKELGFVGIIESEIEYNPGSTFIELLL